MDSIEITIFTPTYNRGYIIEKLYESLVRQTNTNFEWLVIDDGSQDDTETVFRRILNKKHAFPINYIKIANGGKPKAINYGVKIAKGRLFFIVDSDDQLTDDAIDRIISWEKEINGKEGYAGVSGLRGYSAKEMIGTTFDGEWLDCTSLEREKNNLYGDKAEAYYTNVLKLFPFKTFAGENFIELSTVWNAIASSGYKIRWHNKIIYLCEYRDDGLTKNHQLILQKNPQGYAYHLIHNVIEYSNYSTRDKINVYYSYWLAIKEKISLKKCAKYLEISFFKMIYVVARCKLRNIIRRRK